MRYSGKGKIKKIKKKKKIEKSYIFLALGMTVFLLLIAAGLNLEQKLIAQAEDQPDTGTWSAAAEGSEAMKSSELSAADQPQMYFENYTRFTSVKDIDYQIYDLYITVYPTYNEEGKIITRKAFDKHRSLDRAYNPVLNCHIWDGNPNDSGNTEGRVGYHDGDINASIRVRGNSSRGDLVKSYKVKLNDQGAKIFGMDTLNINKHMQDPLRVVNKANMDMMQFIGTNYASLDARFVHLYINDVNEDGSETGFQDQGLYSYVEQPNREFLVNHGLDPYGALYKPIRFEFLRYENEVRSEDDPLYDQAAYERVLKPMQNPDHEKMRAMMDAVNDYSRDFQEVMDTYFDEDNYLTFMAINILTGRKDVLVHNFLLYSPTNTQKWFFLPWDHDESLYYYEVENWSTMNYQSYGVHYYWMIPLHQRYFRLTGKMDKLTAKMEEMMKTVYTEENITYIQQQSIAVLEAFFRDGVDAQMFMDDMIESDSSRLDDYQAAEDHGAYILENMKAEINLWYPGIVNNYQRYRLALNNPTAGHIQEPEIEDGKYVFRWDASYDFQGDRVTYDFQIASDYLFQNILLEQTELVAPMTFVDKLPKGHLFYRYVARDSAGNSQYPLNILDLRDKDDNPIIWAYGMGYINNGAVGDYNPYADLEEVMGDIEGMEETDEADGADEADEADEAEGVEITQ